MSKKPTTSTEIVVHQERAPAKRRTKSDDVGTPPAIVSAAGGGAEFAWDEFFKGSLPNAHTRRNYAHAVRKFLAWCDRDDRKITLIRIAPGDVGEYLQGLELAAPTKKLHLAALRKFFDLLVVRHVVILNPAASARAGRYQVVEGKTEEIKLQYARKLLESIDTRAIVGLRNRAILAVLVHTATRVGAIAKLTVKSLKHDGSQYELRSHEKGGKSRAIRMWHDLEPFLLEYIRAAGIEEGPRFRTVVRRTKQLTNKSMDGIDICRLMKRRLKVAGLPGSYSPHSFRVTTITDLLEQNVPLEDVPYLEGHADPRTTRFYDRRGWKVTRNIVERISI
ncbi:tyrosine-type recombinase/integrase [Singulisphaera sp. Ch08]|uniref:Tyrosine-type recombinase/integrase n=1 Tax=Singulisphaera sp. Ch08 TaxID=3120278 RepID=A0AAU7C929_9BACT